MGPAVSGNLVHIRWHVHCTSPGMDQFRQDLAFGIRAIGRRPGFTVLAASMLALGIGANTAIFSVVNAVVLRPLSYQAPEELFFVGALRGGRLQALSGPEFLALRERARGFEVANADGVNLNLVGEGEPERIAGSRITANLLPLLGVEPVLGRNFLPEEEREGNDAVVLVAHASWKRRFGGDPGALGRRLKLDGREREIVGILPEGFSLPMDQAEILVPMAFTEDELENSGGHFLGAVARLAPGVSAEAATAEADGIVRRAVAGFPDHRGPHGATGAPMLDFLLRDHRSGLLVLSASVGFVLLIACANVANLLLARAAERRREIAMRGALGASRGRIVRQLLTESVLLALVGGTGGVLVALWGVDLVVRLSPVNVPRIDTVAVDWWVFAFAAAISMGAGLLFGLMPALEASKGQMERTLQASSRSDSQGSLHSRSRRLLVAFEVGLALVLLVGAGLTLRSFWNLDRESPGFVADRLLTARLVLPESRYAESSGQIAFARRLLEEIDALPGVRDAGLVAPLPLSDSRWRLSLEIPGREAPADGQPLASNWRTVMPGYFGAMGIPLLAGRDFTALDSRSDEPEPRSVLIINETFARNLFPGEDPLGKRVRIGYDDLLCEVVGVVGDVRHSDLAAASGEEMYTPFAATPVPAMNLAVRVSGEPESIAGGLREAVRRVDPEQPVFGLTAMPDLVRASVASRRFVTTLLLAFAVAALALALLGIYAVISYSVLAQTREIGIRMALGARASEVLGLVMVQGLSLILAGAAVGLLASLLLSRYLESQLYGISGTDLSTYAAVAVFLVVVALAATAIPALRASRLDPIQALRSE
jgi:putative ABC transport system permease protein